MRVSVTPSKCVASGSCMQICPQVFAPRATDGTVHVLAEHPSLDLLLPIQEAAEMCPASVLVIEDELNTSELTVVEENDE